jgi:hypothetical protein
LSKRRFKTGYQTYVKIKTLNQENKPRTMAVTLFPEEPEFVELKICDDDLPAEYRESSPVRDHMYYTFKVSVQDLKEALARVERVDG